MYSSEQDALVWEYVHLSGLPQELEALQMLRKVASLVKPMMRARAWEVGVLAEFYPEDEMLFGM